MAASLQHMPGMRVGPAVWALLLAIPSLIIASPQLLYPLWFDHGAFAACADTLRSGGAPYSNCWEVRGPLVPAIYAIARTASTSWNAIHGLDLLWQWVTACAIAALGWRAFHARLTAIGAGVLYGLMYASLNYWATAQAEGFANLLVVLALFVALGPGASRRNWLLAGVLTGLLFWMKYPFVGFGLLACAATLRAPARARVGGLVSLGVGIVAVAGAGVLGLALSGALADWWTHVQYDVATFHSVPLGARWEWFSGLFRVEVEAFMSHGNTPTAGWKDTVSQLDVLGRGYPWLFAACGLSIVRAILAPHARRATLLVLTYLGLGMALNVWQGHSYRYHFVIWLPALALLASAGLATARAGTRPIVARSARALRLASAGTVILAMLGMVAACAPWIVDFWQNVFVERKPLRVIASESHQRDDYALADFLRANTGVGEAVVVFSDVPAVYALAERPMGTRFPYMRWAEEGGDPEIVELYASQMLADLAKTRPRYFVLTKDGYPWPTARFIDLWKRMRPLNDYVEREYRYVADVGNFVVFVRR